MQEKIFTKNEEIIYKLRKIYRERGYSHYKVSKFEEYDLYAKNKSFLVSENILTFTDINGRLMAMKPDVTLSMVKNAAEDEGTVYKRYYDESVFRADLDGYREITQTGLECIGCSDVFSDCEVVMLAARCLGEISPDYLLDISHQKLVRAILEDLGMQQEMSEEAIVLLGTKNTSELALLCERAGIKETDTALVCALNSMYLPIKQALARISSLIRGEAARAAYEHLSTLADAMEAYGVGDNVYLDLSIVNDMNYYDGIIFNGYIKGLSDSVLSGGRYDGLMHKFGKKSGACGFAIYLDKLARIGGVKEYDADVLITYSKSTPACRVIAAEKDFTDHGMSIFVCREERAAGVKCRVRVNADEQYDIETILKGV